ncbi:hypothetical protein I317_01987 [Kwoniella heveanensis CBS 569]|nr:hypothetical protein I317_01987 [Kwoniella heveanensis CBS 569]
MRAKRPTATATTTNTMGHARRSSASTSSSLSKMRKLGTISENAMTPLNEPFQPDDADLVLFSSDGLGFKVHGTRLAACSSIFKTTLSLSEPTTSSASAHLDCPHDLPELHFPDSSLESSITISLFLHLLYILPLPIPTLPVYFQAYETLLSFLLKYECKTLYGRLGGAVRVWVKEGVVSASKGLKMGDRLDDVELCKKSIKMAGEYSWVGGRKSKSPVSVKVSPVEETGRKFKGRVAELKDQHRRPHLHSAASSSSSSNPAEPKDTVSPVPPDTPSRLTLKVQEGSETSFDIHKDGVEGAASLDLTAVPFEFFCSLTDETKFALLRAMRVGCESQKQMKDGLGEDGRDWEKVAEEFERIMRELRGGCR